MIQSFAFSAVAELFHDGTCHRTWQAFRSVLVRKLDMVDAAVRIEDLRSPPGNRLELLRGDRAGQWSIRINDQWRVCFRWGENGPEEVDVVDYH